MQSDSAHERNLSLGSQLGASVSQRISTFPSKNPDCEQKSREGPPPSLCSRTKWQLPVQLNSVERSDALQNVLLWLHGGCLLRERYELLQSFNLALISSLYAGIGPRLITLIIVFPLLPSWLCGIPNQFYRDFLFHSLRVLFIHVVHRTASSQRHRTGRTRSCKVGPTELFLT